MLGYLSDGAGPALVLIHGVGLRAEAWERIMPALAVHFRVIAVDMPGHGATPLGAVETLEDYVDQVETFVGRLDGPVYVAGHSMGAILAMKLAARLRERISGIAALNAIYQRPKAAKEAVCARASAILSGEEINNTPTLVRWFGKAPKGPIKAAAKDCATWLDAVNREGYGRAYTAFAHQDGPTEDELRRITGPALFMTGAGDLNSTPAMSEAMAGRAPRGRALTIHDAAHMMPMTHPKAVAEALIETFQPGAQT